MILGDSEIKRMMAEGYFPAYPKLLINPAILIRPGYPVAQIVFEQAQGVERPYTGKYCGQTEATGSRMHLDKIPR